MERSDLVRIYGHEKVELKPLVYSIAVFSLLIGLGGAAVTNNYSDTAKGDLKVQKGFYLGINSGGSGGYSGSIEARNLSSGGFLDFGFKIRNRANDRSQPAVQVLSLSADQDLTWRELESLEIKRENGTGYSREHLLDVDARGEPSLREVYRNQTSKTFEQEVGSTSGRGIGVANADVNSDSVDEILVCVSESEGRLYTSNEAWKGDISIDTKTSFPSGDLELNYRLVGLYDPETGTHPAAVRECPQVN